MKEEPGVKQPVVLLEGFEHRPGKHCGSTAIADLFRFYNLELPEAVIIGIAAAPGFYYVEIPGNSPSRLVGTRTARLEHQFIELGGGLLQLEEQEDMTAAWLQAKEHIDSGDPVLLLTDLYYLDHYDNSAHFPGHAVVLAGYDSKNGYLADTDFDGLCKTPLDSLQKARHSTAPPYPVKGEMFTVADPNRVRNLKDRLADQILKSIEFEVSQMLDPEFGDLQGVPAMGRLAQEVELWPKEVEDWQWCTRFAYQVIERRGTGGGGFRKLYAQFLHYAADLGLGDHLKRAANNCDQLADSWTQLAGQFRLASKAEASGPEWDELSKKVAQIHDQEEQLWTTLS